MIRGLFQNKPPGAQLLLLLLLVLMGMLFFTSLGLVLITAFTEFDLIEHKERLSKVQEYPGMLGPYRFLLFFTHLGQFILPALLLPYLIGERVGDFLRFKGIDGKRILFTLGVLFFFFPVSNYLSQLNAGIEFPEWLGWLEKKLETWEEESRSLTEELVAAHAWPDLLRNLFLVAILPAIGEEMIFRGGAQRLLERWSGNVHLAIWVSAALFSAMHMQFYGFLPRLALGALFGYMLIRTGTLWVPILAHFLNNASAVVFSYLTTQNAFPESYEDAGAQEGQGLFVLLSLALVLLIFYLSGRAFADKSSMNPLS